MTWTGVQISWERFAKKLLLFRYASASAYAAQNEHLLRDILKGEWALRAAEIHTEAAPFAQPPADAPTD
jgi:hypothetical protein